MKTILNEYLYLENIKVLRKWFTDVAIQKNYKKGDYFITQEKPCQIVGLVETGAFRFLSYTAKGDEQIVGYSFEKDFVTDYAALVNKRTSAYDIQAIKNSTVLIVSYNDYMDFFKQFSMTDFRTQIAESLFSDISNRLISLYCDTPEERYIKLIHKYPEVLNMISLREIASFLKMTPETLSRIRKKIVLKQKP